MSKFGLLGSNAWKSKGLMDLLILAGVLEKNHLLNLVMSQEPGTSRNCLGPTVASQTRTPAFRPSSSPCMFLTLTLIAA